MFLCSILSLPRVLLIFFLNFANETHFPSKGPGTVASSRVSDGRWHYLQWSRRYNHVTVTVDGVTSEGDMPGSQTAVLNVVHNRVVHVHIGGFPYGSSSVKGKN